MNLIALYKTASLVFTVTFICDSEYLTAQTREPDIRINTDRFSGTLNDLQFSAGGDFLFLFFMDFIWRYNVTQSRFDLQIPTPNRRIYNMGEIGAINAEGTKFTYVDYEAGDVHVINFESGDVFYTLPYPVPDGRSYDTQIMFSSDDSYLFLLYFGYDQEALYIADFTSGVWRMLEIEELENFALSSDGRVAFTTEDWNHRSFYHLRVMSEVQTLDPDNMSSVTGRIFDNSIGIRNLSFSSDGRKILLRQINVDNVDVWHVLDSETLAPLADSWVSPIGGWLTIDTKKHASVYAGWLGNRPIALYRPMWGGSAGFTVFDVREQSVLFSESDILPFDIAFASMKGHLAFRNSKTGTIEVYLGGILYEKAENLTPRLVPQIQHNGFLEGLAISGDGRVVSMAGSDGWVSLWDRASGRVFRRLDFELPTQSLALSQDGLQLLVANSMGHGEIWDVTNGELQGRAESVVDVRLPYDPIFSAFLGDQTKALICAKRGECALVDSFSYKRFNGSKLKIDFDTRDDFCRMVSLAPDEGSIALALGTQGVGWMELNPNGRQRVVEVPEDSRVTTVAALDDARVVAGLLNGNILLIDAAHERIEYSQWTRNLRLESIIRLDDKRLAIALNGKKYYHLSLNDLPPEILVVSTEDLSVLKRLTWSQETDGGGHSSGTDFEFLASNDDGRWLVSSFMGEGLFGQPSVQVWDTAISQTVVTLISNAIPTTRVEFLHEDNYLLADSHEYASLWHIKSGQMTHQFRHSRSNNFNEHRTGVSKSATLDDSLLVYLSYDESSVKSWSPNYGFRQHTDLDTTLTFPKFERGLSADRSRIALFRNPDEVVLLSIDARHGNLTKRIERSNLRGFHLSGDRILLDLGESGIEVVDASTTESNWLRDDININSTFSQGVAFTEDSTGVILIYRV